MQSLYSHSSCYQLCGIALFSTEYSPFPFHLVSLVKIFQIRCSLSRCRAGCPEIRPNRKDYDQIKWRDRITGLAMKSVIERYGLRAAAQYTARTDALTHDNIPVQIKLTKKGGEVCLGSLQNNQEVESDFILHLGFWKDQKDNIVEELTFFVSIEEWKSHLFLENQDNIIDEFKSFSNNKEDDKAYTSFRKRLKDIWGDRLIHLRLKRDHKTQKRIQLAIPNKKIADLPFERIEMSKPVKKEPVEVRENDNVKTEKERLKDAKDKDKFYTDPEIAKVIVEELDKILPLSEYDGIIEPSAGNGSFLRHLKCFGTEIFAIDIEPEGEEIEEADFLKDELYLEGKVAVIGNPPFGSGNSLAIKFFNRAAHYKLVDLIAFVLPRSFRKESVQDKLNSYFHLVADFDIPLRSFLLLDKPYEVPCCFLVWERRRTKRMTTVAEIPNKNYVFDKKGDIAIRRVGINAGRASVFKEDSFSPSSHYFIRFIKTEETVVDIETFIKEFNALTWPKDNPLVQDRFQRKNSFEQSTS